MCSIAVDCHTVTPPLASKKKDKHLEKAVQGDTPQTTVTHTVTCVTHP